MADESLTTAPAFPPLADAASGTAPIIYFNAVPNFGTFDGVANMTLETVLHITDNAGKVAVRRAIVAHLRMSAHGLANLKSAIEGIELLEKPAQPGQPN